MNSHLKFLAWIGSLVLKTFHLNRWSTLDFFVLQVQKEDAGCYMCQINTATMKKQLGCVRVHVPPDIITQDSSSEVTVNEGHNTGESGSSWYFLALLNNYIS